jgi:hypothetical protein
MMTADIRRVIRLWLLLATIAVLAAGLHNSNPFHKDHPLCSVTF